MSRVLFVCLQNAGRSQMSQALFEWAAGERQKGDGRHEARSAGTNPADSVHPEAIAAMEELGIGIGDRTPQALTDELARWADLVITMGCGDKCPFIPGREYRDWELPDPSGRSLEEVRAIRDEIAARTDALVAELDRQP